MHLPFYMTPDTDVVLYGHTHEFKSEMIQDTLFLNPGESCARNKPISECAMLEVKPTKLKVTYYAKAKNDKEFTSQKFTYDRKIS